MRTFVTLLTRDADLVVLLCDLIEQVAELVTRHRDTLVVEHVRLRGRGRGQGGAAGNVHGLLWKGGGGRVKKHRREPLQ